jgi:O-antigen ligase
MSVIQVATGGAIQLQGIKASTQQTLSYAGAGLVGLFRPSGLLSHPNALADFLVLLLPMLAGFLLLGRRATGNAFVTMSWLLMAGLFMLILTLSRGGWMAFAVGMMCFIILGYRRNIVSALHIKRMVVGIVLGAMITLVAFPTVYLRLTESDNQSTHSRVLLAEQALLIVERNPIQGVGLGAYNYAAHRNMPESFSSIEPAFRDNLLKGLVHNKYLLVAAETGLVGLLLFLNVFRVAFLSLWRIRFDNDSPRQTLALGLLAGLAAGLSAFLLEPSESGVPIETTSIMLGACMALTRTRIPYATSQPKSISFEMRSISR